MPTVKHYLCVINQNITIIMRNRTITFFLMLMAFVSVSAQRTFVLSVGVSQYADPNVPNLSQTAKDAMSFRDLMLQHTRDVTTLTSKYANHDNIMEKLRALCNRAGSGDRIIFFFSGHGFEGGIAVHDRVILYSELLDQLQSSQALEKYVFIDACHAGTAVSSNKGHELAKAVGGSPGTVMFVSCRPDEVSAENPFVGKGHFTQAILKGLRGKADANGDRAITVIELFTYIYNDVLHATRKTPRQQHSQLIAPKATHQNVIVQW